MSDSNPPELLVLPSFIVSKGQVYQLLGEILQIEKFLSEVQNRAPGTKMTLPKTTVDLDKFAESNKRNVLHHGQRIQLARFLRQVYQHAPDIGVMMPGHVDKAILEGITLWFRSNVHAQALMTASINNRLYGGILLRIRHKTYNFSLEPRFLKADNILRESIINERSVVIDYSPNADKSTKSLSNIDNNPNNIDMQSSVLASQPEPSKTGLTDSNNESKPNSRSSYF